MLMIKVLSKQCIWSLIIEEKLVSHMFYTDVRYYLFSHQIVSDYSLANPLVVAIKRYSLSFHINLHS